MTQKPDVFEFVSYEIQPDKKTINFNYRARDLSLTEKITLPAPIPSSINPLILKNILNDLHLILGITYFKLHCSKKIIMPYHLSKAQADFWNTVYTKGLGEFFYKNKIDFRSLINFPYFDILNTQPVQLRQLDEAKKNRFLVGIGGGKDSVVSVEILKKENKEITGFILDSQNTPPQIQIDVAKKMEINYLIVKRQLDPQIFDLRSAYNGHIPITAIYSFIALLLAVIYNYSSIVIPNGKSANFGNVNYLGVEINHQWSKSEEFEKLFQEYVKQNITSNIDLSSNLRAYSEMEIAKMFSTHKKYFSFFSSCNRNFKIKGSVDQKKWCGECAKCAFVFIILSAYLPKKEVVEIFNKNLLDDSKLIPLYQDLIGKGKMKPFDCVGTFEESTEVIKIIKNKGEFNSDVVIKNL
ncbi:MAG: hypothetical protein NUV87_03295 [Candidatus Roizmanbacteria bacterium]|nr:hypothetical protein [Candidatus Roizmanbacteria bacterium]